MRLPALFRRGMCGSNRWRLIRSSSSGARLCRPLSLASGSQTPGDDAICDAFSQWSNFDVSVGTGSGFDNTPVHWMTVAFAAAVLPAIGLKPVGGVNGAVKAWVIGDLRAGGIAVVCSVIVAPLIASSPAKLHHDQTVQISIVRMEFESDSRFSGREGDRDRNGPFSSRREL